ncbi:MAG: CoA transferase, partial [Deltaproteobacteria bacterium]
MSNGEGSKDVNGGALKGYKVIDFGQMVSAPFCAKLFSDFGADV